jgi:ATP-binding protein involved in chromosome partitioning
MKSWILRSLSDTYKLFEFYLGCSIGAAFFIILYFGYLQEGLVIMISQDEIYESLRKIVYPGFDKDIISLGIVKDVSVADQVVHVVLDLRTQDKTAIDQLVNDITQKINEIKDVKDVKISVSGPEPAPQSQASQAYLTGVKYKIAVASGKGGVGKSTVSVNLAVALARQGLKVGLLDSDIYGPSIPLMLGVTDRPEFDGNKLIPVNKYGVSLMSLGFLVDDESPVIWRGPLVMRALQQLMGDVDWGELDVILFDMPPGTGDAQLTISQSIQLDGAVIVSTPQDVALLDAVKGVKMFEKVNVPILGIVENMSYFCCPDCGTRTDIFSAGGAKEKCDQLNIKLLGEIPIDVEIRQGGDSGVPVVEGNPENPQSKAFAQIAQKVMDNLKKD